MNRKTIFLTISIYCLLFIQCANSEGNSKTLIDEIDDSRMVRGTLKISPDYKRIAYVALGSEIDKKTYSIILDSKIGKEYSDIRALTFSADGKRFAYVANVGDRSCVVVDGKEGSKYDRIMFDGFTSDSKKIVYRVYKNGKWHMVINDELGKPYLKIDAVHFGPDDNIAYVIEERDPRFEEWDVRSRLNWVVFNEKEGIKFQGTRVQDSSWLFRFSPDGKRLAYVVKPGNVFVDNTMMAKGYERVQSVTFSPDSTKLRYVAYAGNFEWVIGEDGKEVVTCKTSRNIFACFSPDGKRMAYEYYKGKEKGYAVVIDGVEGKTYKDILKGPIFSPDSKRVVYVATNEENAGKLVLAGQNGEVYLEAPLPFECKRRGGGASHIKIGAELQQIIYIAVEGNKKIVQIFEVVDKEVIKKLESKKYDRVYSIIFSPNSKNIAYVANIVDKNGYTTELVVINNKEGKRYGEVEKPIFIDNNTLRYIAWEGSPIIAGDTLYHLGNKLYLIEEKIK